jgi:hypothetical protein
MNECMLVIEIINLVLLVGLVLNEIRKRNKRRKYK